MLRYMCSVFGAGLGAVFTAFISWGIIVLFFPSTNIDSAFNAIVIFLLLGAVAGFALCFKHFSNQRKQKNNK